MSDSSASLCRLCLNTEEVRPIFSDDLNSDDDDDVSKKIYECLAIQISKDNVLPKVICLDCLGCVNNWFLFKKKCYQTQTALHSMFKKELGEDVLKVKAQRINGVIKQKKASEVLCVSDSDDDVEAQPVPEPPMIVLDDDEVSMDIEPKAALEVSMDVTPSDDKPSASEHEEKLENGISPTIHDTLSGNTGLRDDKTENFVGSNEIEQLDNINSETKDESKELEGSGSVVNNTPEIESVENESEPSLALEKSGEKLESAIDNGNPSLEPGIDNSSSLESEKLAECPEDKRTEDPIDGTQPRKDEVQPEPSQTDPNGLSKEDEPRIESSVSLSFEAFDDEETTKELKDKEGQDVNKDDDNDHSASGSQMDEADDSTNDINIDEQTQDSTVSSVCDTILPISIKAERMDPGYGDIEPPLVQIKSEPLSDSEMGEGQKNGSIDLANLADDPALDLTTNTCRMCNYRYSSVRNLLRHCNSKLHQSLASRGVSTEVHSILKRALIKKKVKRRRGPFLSFKRKYQCKICRLQYQSASSLYRHAQVHRFPEEPILDTVQPETMEPLLDSSVSQVEEDYDDKQYDDRDYICPMPNCNYSCNEGSELLKHMTSHGINKIKNKPPTPSTSIQSSSELTITKTEVPKKEYRCEFHDVTFFDGRGYGNHLRTCQFAKPLPKEERASPVKTFCCKICNLKFSNKEIHLNHLRIYHRLSIVDVPSQQEQEQPQPQPEQPPEFPAHFLVPSQPPKMQLARSLLKNRRPNAYSCNTCGKRFNFLYSLNYHTKTCGLVPSTPSAPLIKPEASEEAPEPMPSVTCKFCKKSFKTYKVYRIHLKTHFVPPGSKKLFCSKCCKTFDSRSELGYHRARGQCKSMIKMKIFSCSICNHSFKELESLKRHKEIEHGRPRPEREVERPVDANAKTFCKICSRNYYNVANLRRHVLTVHALSEEEFKNMGIREGEPQEENVADVIKEEEIYEGQEPEYPCKHCGKKFKLQRILTLHLNNFCTQSPKKPKCEKCGTVKTKKECELCPPVEEAPVDLPPEASSGLFKCPIGKTTFTSQSSMLRHYTFCNGDCEEVITCSTCSKAFKDEQSLDAHSCGKKRLYRYNCVKCLRTFSRKNYLANHESKCTGNPEQPSNTGSLVEIKQEEPQNPQIPPQTSSAGQFRCKLCSRVFHSQKSMSGHMWIHKPKGKHLKLNSYSCKFCSRENIVLKQLYPHNYKCIKNKLMTEHSFKCYDCETFFTRQDAPKELSSKVQSHVVMCYPIPYYKNQEHNEDSPKLLCCYCSYAFSSVESLAAHKAEHVRMKKARSATGPYVKPRKRIRTNSGQALGVHFLDNFIQEGAEGDYEYETVDEFTDNSFVEEIFSCGICSEQFPTMDKLKTHEELHENVEVVE